MGAGSSRDLPDIEDDELGVDERCGRGVMQRIPVEMKPRGKIGVRAGRSLSKHKPPSSSLRSALSLETAENLEVCFSWKRFDNNFRRVCGRLIDDCGIYWHCLRVCRAVSM